MPGYEYEIGLHKNELDTPALLLDLDVMERNLEKMARFFDGKNVKLRPHVKLHKATLPLAHRQLQAGAVGLTCAKLAEAETLASGGIRDILIANQVVGERKVRRLVNLAAYTDVMVAVDSYENIEEISQAAQARGVRVRALVEVDVGNHRCGVEPFGPALEMSKAVQAASGLVYMGLMGYDGHCTFQPDSAEPREQESIKANTILADTRRFVEQAGLEVKIVSAAGSFTYKYASSIPGITEIQAGSYLLMDTAFREKGVSDFDCALTVLATVTSRPPRPDAKDMAILDSGRKSIDPFYGMPEVKRPEGAVLYSMPQEHARLRLTGPAQSLKVGDKVELWVRDANGTINLYDKFFAMRGETVEAVWEIGARGRST